MIDSKTIRVAIPAYDGKVVCELAGSLIASANRFAGVSLRSGVSLVPLVRNIIAHEFMSSNFEWLVCIDSDIAFTPQDFHFLLEPWNQNHIARDEPQPSRVTCEGWARPLSDGSGRMARGKFEADAIVSAEYAYKNELLEPCRMGLGFTRIHRSVFETLQHLTHSDGTARLWQFRHQGQMFFDYFPCGPFVAQLIPGAQWKGEDHGFFTLCAIAGIIPRIETRTRLVHIGVKGYPYYESSKTDPFALANQVGQPLPNADPEEGAQ